MQNTTSNNAATQTTTSRDERVASHLSCRSKESPLEQGVEYVRHCVNEHPEAAALWCLGIGFVLGWKLKPW